MGGRQDSAVRKRQQHGTAPAAAIIFSTPTTQRRCPPGTAAPSLLLLLRCSLEVGAVAAALVPVLEQVGQVVADDVAEPAELGGTLVGQAELQGGSREAGRQAGAGGLTRATQDSSKPWGRGECCCCCCCCCNPHSPHLESAGRGHGVEPFQPRVVAQDVEHIPAAHTGQPGNGDVAS